MTPTAPTTTTENHAPPADASADPSASADAAATAPAPQAFGDRYRATIQALFILIILGMIGVAARVIFTPQSPASSHTQSPASDPPTHRININTADRHTLQLLPDIGPAYAQAIIDHRTQHGPFTTTEQLENVHGIGPARRRAIEQWITLDQPPPQPEPGQVETAGQ